MILVVLENQMDVKYTYPTLDSGRALCEHLESNVLSLIKHKSFVDGQGYTPLKFLKILVCDLSSKAQNLKIGPHLTEGLDNLFDVAHPKIIHAHAKPKIGTVIQGFSHWANPLAVVHITPADIG